MMIKLFLVLLAIAQTTWMNESFADSHINVSYPQWPPYFYGKQDKKGFGRDIIEQCLAQMKQDHSFKYMPIARANKTTQMGLIDLNVYSKKKGREEWLHYGSEPLYEVTYNPVTLKSKSIRLSGLKDFDPYRIGHQIGMKYSLEYQDYLNSRRTQKGVDEVRNHESNMRKLLHGRIDVYVSTRSDIEIMAKQLKVSDQIRVHDLEIRKAKYYLTVPKNAKNVKEPKKLLGALDSCLKKMKATGSYCNLAKGYGVPCP
ncbi:substrate-binding periplasmic protein [Pseudobacteriovorax antillogorgiicola]|uniref:Polar amino acid transport system substrate-binding protein n=1 Tax=Pseudobacteriovorax antillogorgiicola TaxID=1513793 RepID=A0A1Y6CHS8_9BACT|nr:transporter substrate-binding domain-containing protein [Pseudobacteriovorax antillogorgiicola]TCS47002.1 polar amino acid transport system substrate-binding protein [Pseudobacteriovorax antillogorgiicola]SMF64957.1 polar amino acid transport system substrate-binding protein [Pseudobacteriovorax antillogorgiicola]